MMKMFSKIRRYYVTYKTGDANKSIFGWVIIDRNKPIETEQDILNIQECIRKSNNYNNNYTIIILDWREIKR